MKNSTRKNHQGESTLVKFSIPLMKVPRASVDCFVRRLLTLIPCLGARTKYDEDDVSLFDCSSQKKKKRKTRSINREKSPAIVASETRRKERDAESTNYRENWITESDQTRINYFREIFIDRFSLLSTNSIGATDSVVAIYIGTA